MGRRVSKSGEQGPGARGGGEGSQSLALGQEDNSGGPPNPPPYAVFLIILLLITKTWGQGPAVGGQ